jgi:FKBP12-rapamycin complex-associated protein
MLTEIMKNYEYAWTYDESNSKAWNAYAVLNYDLVNYFKQILNPSTTKIIDCTISGVKSLLKSIILSKGKFSLQNTLRLLTLWFEYGYHRQVYDVLHEGIHTIPVEIWLQVLPQLIARIDSPRILVHQLIRQLLIDIARQHPQALIYPLVVASKSMVRERKIAANRVLDNMREHSHTLVQQAMIVSEELIRISILWDEIWYEGLETVGKYLSERNIQGKYIRDSIYTYINEIV